MASMYWIGGTTAVAQEVRGTPGGTIEVGDKFLVALVNEGGTTVTITATATGTTVAQVCADLLTAWNASTSSLKTGITASNQTTYFKLLGTAGTPFYVTFTTTETDDSPADAQTFTKTTTTANSGPSDWNTAANWSGGAVPVSTDNVVIDGRATANITYGLDQSAVTLTTLTIKQSNSYNVGTTAYALRVSATTCTIGEAATDGSFSSGAEVINLDFGTNANATRVAGSASQGSSGLEPVMLKGINASNSLTVEGGNVGYATAIPGQTATLPAATIEAGKLTLGPGCTLTTVEQTGGTLAINSAVTTLTQRAGTLVTRGTYLVTNLYSYGGTAQIEHRNGGSDTVTTLYMRGGTVDMAQNTAAATVDTLNYRAGTIRQPSAGVAFDTVALDFNSFTQLSLTAA